MPLPLFNDHKQIQKNKIIKPTIMPKAEEIENPRASKSEEPNIENLKALIMYKMGFARETVCQNGGSN